MQKRRELESKLARIRKLLVDKSLSAVLLRRQSNFSWLTCGGMSYVSIASEYGVGTLLVTKDDCCLLTNKIESGRLKDEEITELGIKIIEYDWFSEGSESSLIKELVPNGTIGADDGRANCLDVSKLAAELRYSLTEDELDRYRIFGKESADVLSRVCQEIKPGITEFETAGLLSEMVWDKGAVPFVVLVAADDRIMKYRHPIPTENKLKNHIMIVLCAKKSGLVVALTRFVYFGKLPDVIRKKHDSVCKVDSDFILATYVGQKYSNIFKIGMQSYANEGYPDEWKLHHQGGPTGYEGRDFKATMNTEEKVVLNQSVAWNPSITGTKSEDTIIAASKQGDIPEILTISQNWPLIQVETKFGLVNRPDILIR